MIFAVQRRHAEDRLHRDRKREHITTIEAEGNKTKYGNSLTTASQTFSRLDANVSE